LLTKKKAILNGALENYFKPTSRKSKNKKKPQLTTLILLDYLNLFEIESKS